MAETKLKTRSPFVAAESLAVGASAETIAAAGGTIPQNTSRIHFYVPASDTIRWLPNGTPTTSFGHLISAQNWGVLEHNQQGGKLISGDGSDVTLIIVYERGAGRADAAYSLTAPY
jgi:hypothetical protein